LLPRQRRKDFELIREKVKRADFLKSVVIYMGKSTLKNAQFFSLAERYDKIQHLETEVRTIQTRHKACIFNNVGN